jgi:mannose-1-phosphate guanylyltransferase
LTCVVFGAGRGKRMRPLSDVVPKPAIPVLDVCLGAFALTPLLMLDARIVVNASHLVSEMRRRLIEPLDDGRTELMVEEPEALGTAGTLRAVADDRSRVLTCNGDLVTDIDVASFVESHVASGAPCSLAVVSVKAGADLEVSGAKPVRFIDRRRTDVAGVRFIGLTVFEPEVMRLLPHHVPAGLGETLLPQLVASGDVRMHIHGGYALDIAGPRELLHVSQLALANEVRLPAPVPGDIVEVDGGLAYLGPNARAPAHRLGPGSILLRGASVGRGSHVERSIVWENESVDGGGRLDGGVWFDDHDILLGMRGE